MKSLLSFIFVSLFFSCSEQESYLFQGTSSNKEIWREFEDKRYEVLSSADYEIRFTPKNEKDSFFIIKIENLSSEVLSQNDNPSNYYYNDYEIKIYDKFENVLIQIESKYVSQNANIEYYDEIYDAPSKNETYKGIPRPPTFLQICMREGHYQGHTLKANNLGVRGRVKA